jgi:hypothetical protein
MFDPLPWDLIETRPANGEPEPVRACLATPRPDEYRAPWHVGARPALAERQRRDEAARAERDASAGPPPRPAGPRCSARAARGSPARRGGHHARRRHALCPVRRVSD